MLKLFNYSIYKIKSNARVLHVLLINLNFPVRSGQDNDEIDSFATQTNSLGSEVSQTVTADGDKPKRKTIRRKPKSKLAETFPTYLQEAFFGKEILESVDIKKEIDSFSSDEEKLDNKFDSIKLSQVIFVFFFNKYTF